MGATSSILPNEKTSNDFAFSIVKQVYEESKLNPPVDDDINQLTNIPEADYYGYFRELYINSRIEYELPFEECRCPFVILHKYKLLNDKDKKIFSDAIVYAATMRFNDKSRNNSKVTKKADYSQSFSGTAEDTQKEKEAADLLRGIFVSLLSIYTI